MTNPTSAPAEASAAAAALQRPARRRWPRGRVLVTSLLVLLVVAGLGFDVARRLLDVAADLRQANAAAQRSRATLAPLLQFDAESWPDRAGYDALVRDLDTAEEHLERARDRLGYLRGTAAALGFLPVVGEPLAASPRALDLGIEVAHHGGEVLRAGEPLFAGQGKVAARAREVLVVRFAQLDASLAALEEASAEAQRLRQVRWAGPFAPASSLVDGLAGDLGRVHAAREMARDASQGLEPLLGFDGQRTYVVLGQNEQEIRATGGYPGTMGLITVKDGRLVSSDYRSTLEFDPPQPSPRAAPMPLQHFMAAGAWYVRDANWDADFPTSAQRVLAFMKEDQGIEADGVVAVNTPMIQLLLRATGPLTIEGIAEPLTADNFLAQTEEEIFESGFDSVKRKQQVLQPVLRELIARVQDAGADRVPPLIAAFAKGARGRDLQVYARDERSAALVTRLHVDGALKPQPGRDFLAVVDSNVSWNKIQIAISREITYLARTDGRVDVLVRWTNERSKFGGTRYTRLGQGGELWDPKARRLTPAPGSFGNYVRFYVPPGARFERIEGLTEPALVLQGEVASLGGLVVVPDGKTVSVRFTYVPLGSPEQRAGGLDLWKQGGQTRDTLRVQVAERVGAQDVQHTLHDGVFDRDLSFDFKR